MGSYKILVVIIGSDETRTAKWSSQSSHPIYLWLGNSTRAIRESELGRVLVGLLPILPSNEGLVKAHLPHYRAWIYHTCLRILFHSLKQASLLGIS
jgi:hypothetical protein